MNNTSDGAKTKTYGLVALAAILVALLAWWRSGAPDANEGDPAATNASASATPAGDGIPAPVVTPRGSDVEPWRAPRAAVAGTVRDDRGQPIAGAQVCAVLQDDAFTQAERRPPQCATTREDGSYRLDELLAADHHLHASARGHVSARYRAPSGRSDRPRSRVPLRAGITREGVDFVLRPGGVEVTGVVKDIAGGEIEGAWVTCSTDEWDDQGSAFARSDADGRFSLWVEPTELHVRAFADGYTRGSRTVSAPGTFIELFLTPESVLVGKVVRADGGEPVAGARVSTAASGFAAFFGQDPGSVITGDDGRFRLEGLEPGGYEIWAVSEELRGRAAERIHVGLAQTSDPVIVPVYPAFAVRGSVLIDDQAPCPFAAVVLQDRNDKDTSYGSGTGQEDGTVLVRGVGPGTYGVSVYCEGAVSEDAYPDVVVTDGSLEGLTWSVHEGGILRGVVLDASGQPVRSALVSARGKAADGDPRARRSSGRGERTTAEGTFVIDGLLPGTYEVSAYHRDFPAPHEPSEVVVPEGGTVEGVTLTMLASGEVHGIVRDEAGEPVAGASVGIKGPRLIRGLTNDEGRFAIQGVEVGEHRVVAERSGSAAPMRAPGASDDDEAGQRVQVRAGEVTELELVVESQGGRITGVVLDEDGEPVPDAFVDAVRESDSAASSASRNRMEVSWSSWTRQPVLTDEDGRFELTALAERGSYAIHANRKGGGEAFAEHVRSGSSNVELTIEATGLLAGVVRLEGGGAPERFQINVTDLASGTWQTDRFSRTGGKWRVTNLPPGSYQIGVTAAEGNAKLEVELAQGAQKTDVELVLSPRVRLRGTLVDATTGEPVTGLKVTVASAGSPVTMMMEGGVEADQKDVSDAQGRFEVDDAPTGSVYVIAMAPGLVQNEYGMSWISRRIPSTPREQDLGRIDLIADRTGDEQAGDLGFKNKQLELDTEPEAVRHVVAVVRPRGPAAAAGLKVGDEIITVDGQDVRGLQSYRYGSLTRVPAGTAVKLEVVDGEGQRTVTVTAGPPT